LTFGKADNKLRQVEFHQTSNHHPLEWEILYSQESEGS